VWGGKGAVERGVGGGTGGGEGRKREVGGRGGRVVSEKWIESGGAGEGGGENGVMMVGEDEAREGGREGKVKRDGEGRGEGLGVIGRWGKVGGVGGGGV